MSRIEGSVWTRLGAMFQRHAFGVAGLAVLALSIACDPSTPVEPPRCPDVLQADLVPATTCVATHGAIEGRVVDAADSRPVVGAMVATSPPTATALTGEDGRFEIGGIALEGGERRLSVTAVKIGYASTSTETVLTGESPRIVVDLPIAPLADRTGPGPPAPGGTLSARVLHRGRPVAGADVEILDPAGEPAARETTDAEGFALFGSPGGGSWIVHATATIADRPFEGYAGVTIAAGEGAYVEVDLRRVF